MKWPRRRGPLAMATAHRFHSITLLAEFSDTARAARRTTRETLEEWGLVHLADDVELCVSELVGNAVHHATPDAPLCAGERHIAVALRAWPKWLFVEVSDEDSTPPMLPLGDLPELGESGASPDALLPEAGRGLFIVQSLADAVWWAPRRQGGKSVFCRFDLNGGVGGGGPTAL